MCKSDQLKKLPLIFFVEKSIYKGNWIAGLKLEYMNVPVGLYVRLSDLLRLAFMDVLILFNVIDRQGITFKFIKQNMVLSCILVADQWNPPIFEMDKIREVVFYF